MDDAADEVPAVVPPVRANDAAHEAMVEVAAGPLMVRHAVHPSERLPLVLQTAKAPKDGRVQGSVPAPVPAALAGRDEPEASRRPAAHRARLRAVAAARPPSRAYPRRTASRCASPQGSIYDGPKAAAGGRPPTLRPEQDSANGAPIPGAAVRLLRRHPTPLVTARAALLVIGPGARPVVIRQLLARPDPRSRSPVAALKPRTVVVRVALRTVAA